MKKVTVLTVLLLVLITATTCFASSDGIKVYIEDKLLEFDIQPMIVDGRTMVPMRKIFEELGADVQWDGETKTITGTKDDTTIVMQLDNKEMTVDDEVVTLDVPPFETGGRTLVPVRAIAESFGVDVKWYGDSKIIKITGDKQNTADVNSNITTTKFEPNMSDVSVGGINYPFYPSDPLDTKYKIYFPLKYQPSVDSDTKKIYIHINRTIDGSDAQEKIRGYRTKIKETCSTSQAWRIYDIEIVYSHGEGELMLNEIITIDNIFTEDGTKYVADACYLIVGGEAFKDGTCEKTIFPGTSKKVRLALLTDKKPGYPLLAIKYSNGYAAKYIHIVSSKYRKTDESSASDKTNSSNNYMGTTVYDNYNTSAYYYNTNIPTYTSVTGVPLKQQNYTKSGYAVYRYEDTKIGEYSEMIDYMSYLRQNGWKQIAEENDGEMLSYGFAKNNEIVLVSFVSVNYGWEVWVSPDN